MSSLLSSLIYNNSQNSEPSSKAAEEKYEFDPYDNFYGRDYTEDEPSIHNGTEGKTNDNGEKKEYDFQKNSQDRDFYLSEATRAKQWRSRNTPTKKMAAPTKLRWNSLNKVDFWR